MTAKTPELSRHTKVVVRMKYAGISNVDIARKLGISDERVRQIWLFSLRRTILKAPSTVVTEEKKVS